MVASETNEGEATNEETHSAGEEHELGDEEEHQASALVHLVRGDGVTIETDRVVPRNEAQKRSKQLPGDFDEDLGQKESYPGVCF